MPKYYKVLPSELDVKSNKYGKYQLGVNLAINLLDDISDDIPDLLTYVTLSSVCRYLYNGNLIAEVEPVGEIYEIPNPPHALKTNKLLIKSIMPVVDWFENLSSEDKQLVLEHESSDMTFNGHALKLIRNPTEEQQIMAVSRSGCAIRDILNPSEAVKLASVRCGGTSIRYITNPSEEIQLAAVKRYAFSIMHIPNPSELVSITAVKLDNNVLQYY